MSLIKKLYLLIVVLFATHSNIFAEEGMWPFSNVPKAEIKRRYGFEVTDKWLQNAQLASVRLNSGGSGSFVSPEGLVLTNHHVASETLQKLSTPEKDLVKRGFYAPTKEKELKAPDLELNVLVSIEDVTEKVNANIKPAMSSSETNEARTAAIAAIEKEASKNNIRADVVTLYHGGQYHLYRYKRYTDVRLVFAPEFEVAFFGGDPDNFTFPRYCLDMTLFRVYENNQPLKVENYFKWSATGSKNGDLVFVSGHPGTTQRLYTVSHLEYLRDSGYPFLIRYLERRHRVLSQYSSKGEEQARQALEDLLSIENTLKSFRGSYEGLRDKSLMDRKREQEKVIVTHLSSNAEKKKQFGDPWSSIGRARKSLLEYDAERRLIENGMAFESTLFRIARNLVRLAFESEKPNAERLREYSEAGKPSLELGLYSTAPIYKEFERASLADSLLFLSEEMGASHPLVAKVLAGKSPQDRAKELVDGTKLEDVNVRKQIAAGGTKAIRESKDPMIELALLVDDRARSLRKRYDNEVTGIERDNYASISRLLFDKYGTSIYPDATFTLRLSYGTVRGYNEGRRKIEPYTYYKGLYERAAAHNYKKPYTLPESWVKSKNSLRLNTEFNFVSTTDIVGGNSGSPVFNRNSELVGLIFDGNIQSLAGSFIYDDRQNRSIAVDTRGMIEALRVVYSANELIKELTGNRP
jgi:hypothetical protein